MSPENPHNELLLVQEMQAGSQEAFTALYRFYSPKMYSNIVGMVRDTAIAEEIVQELFTRIWQSRSNRGLQENFTGYMYRIAQHLVHDFFRRLKRDRLLMEKFSALASENYESLDELLHQQQSTAIIHRAIGQLPPQQKRAYELVRLEGRTYKEAAGIMGISHFTVKEYLVAANKFLKVFLLKNTDSPLVLLAIMAAYNIL